jgi:hypothetical protein
MVKAVAAMSIVVSDFVFIPILPDAGPPAPVARLRDGPSCCLAGIAGFGLVSFHQEWGRAVPNLEGSGTRNMITNSEHKHAKRQQRGTQGAKFFCFFLFTQKEHLAAFQGEQAARLDQFGRPGNVRMLNSSLSDEMPNRS